MRKRTIYTITGSLLTCGAVLSGQALAQQLPSRDFSYDYVEGGMVFTEYDRGGLDEEPLGPRLIGSTSLARNFFVQGEGSYLSDDTDITTLTLGLGYRLAATDSVDLYSVASGAFRNIDPDRESSDHEAGYQLTAGIRHGCIFLDHLAHTWEIRYLDIDTGKDIDDGVVNLRAKPVYSLTQRWDAVGELQIEDAADERNLGLALGARYNF
ncbi:MAG: outer membrane beta-barrel protein [Halorhodospira sp.]